MTRNALLFAFVVCLGVICTAPTWAQVNGAIYTTTSTGTIVNGNLYQSKADVYLNGGPQNKQDPGLVPDGLYYFQVTDPSGAVLLSKDDISCRQVVVSNGRIVGVPGGAPPSACVDGYHNPGTPNSSNGETPVQLCNPNSSKCPTDFDDTPNPGGEYKAWLTPIANYNNCSSQNSNVVYGFCDSDSKTDNFKVKKANAAYVTVCKFNDLNGSGTQDSTEPLIAFWPITATGVDTLTGPIGTVYAQTDANGCVSFSVSTFDSTTNTATVTLTEGSMPGWQETAPIPGTYGADGNAAGSGPTLVSGFVQTITVKPGDSITAPSFGNTCTVATCGGNNIQLVVTKDANPSFTRTFTWQIGKSVDQTPIYTAGGAPGTLNYAVNVSHDSGTDSAWMVTGTIKVSNPSLVDITGVNVTDAVDNGANNCSVMGGSNITAPASASVQVHYNCSYSGLPPSGTNTATAAWDIGSATGTASVDFTGAVPKVVDGSVAISDIFDSGPSAPLGSVSSTDPNPKQFTYSKNVADPQGKCTPHTNTATFTTSDSGAMGSASQPAQDCQGADLTVRKTATANFKSNITKSVDKTKVEQAGGTVTFNYTVKVTESNWAVSGGITVTNPNDWEDITANVGDVLTGAPCVVTGLTNGNVLVSRSSSVIFPYTCNFSSAPASASGLNTATASWNSANFHTPDASASGSASYLFGTLTVTDTFNGKTTTLGSISSPAALTTYTYSHTITNAIGGSCAPYTNTAVITQTGQPASQTVVVCNTKTGALTMGFWQNKNGQGIITNGASTGGVCNSGTWLRMFAPFQDPNLSPTATCGAVATYVYNIIKAANASGATMNAMLKAQMLATALDVYFSDPSLGGNMIGAAQPLGNVKIDLTQVCSMLDNSSSGSGTCSGTSLNASAAFGGSTSLTVLNLLTYAASQSNLGGGSSYGQNKSTQGLAKNTFDAINNQAVYIAP